MLHALRQQVEDHGVPQIIVRPQGGIAVGAHKAVPHHHPGRVSAGIKPAARADGAHHVHVSLEDEKGRLLPAGRGGHVSHHVPRPVPDG